MAKTTSSPQESSAKAILQQALKEWGIGELYKDAEALLRQGLDPDAIMFQLQDTDVYKKRFSANDERRKNGLAVLSPAEYVAIETQYRTVMRTFGLPKGFYDSSEDLASFIGRDVSPTELTERASVAQSIWLSTDAETKKIWTDWHGLSNGAAIASILDPDVALPVIERMALSAQIGGAAARNNMTVTEDRANLFADMGVDASSAMEGYSDIAQRQRVDSGIAARFGTDFTQKEQEDERILGTASSRRKHNKLYEQESALFDGRAGAAGGALSRQSSGQY